jgi:hypothetical protein
LNKKHAAGFQELEAQLAEVSDTKGRPIGTGKFQREAKIKAQERVINLRLRVNGHLRPLFS